MKVFSFFIHSNLLIAFAAVALAIATQVQLGMNPHANACLAVIFFATLIDYNFHRYKAVNSDAGAEKIEKLTWAVQHLKLVQILIFIAFAGLFVSLLFVSKTVVYTLVPLVVISIVYSFSFPGKPNQSFHLLKIPGLKTLLIAFVWSAVTVLLPVLQADESLMQFNVFILFAARFTFIFAIAIPFDVRDMEADKLKFIKSIPVVFGEKTALKASNISLLLSISLAIFYNLHENTLYLLYTYLISIVVIFIFINSRTLKKLPFYYHGILDGSILLHGILISLSHLFKV